MISSVFKRIKDITVRLGDPDRDARIEAYAKAVEGEVKAKRESFSLESTLDAFGVPKRERSWVIARTYERFLRRAWADERISDGEQAALRWVAKTLALSDLERTEIDKRMAYGVFRAALGDAFADHHLQQAELANLNAIAAAIGCSAHDLVRSAFREDGEAFIRGVFATSANHALTPESWRRVAHAARLLGFAEEETRTMLAVQAEQYVEHMLADAKSDEALSDGEAKHIEWVLTHLPISRNTAQYVRHVVDELLALGDIRRGRLPVWEQSRISLDAGEICHFEGSAVHARVRHLKSGPQVDRVVGTVTITDYQMIFSSSEQSFRVLHSRVITFEPTANGFLFDAGGRRSGAIAVEANPQLVAEIYRVAVGKAKQTIVDCRTDPQSRHIPRAVRQRVWQTYGGRCADCGATDYLEYDHVIPVAKGGSNGDGNVQLLCRKCNMKKSDYI